METTAVGRNRRGEAYREDEGLLNGKRKENCKKRREIQLEESREWSTQGSVLAPIKFVLYINDMLKGIKSYLSLFADDAKLIKKKGRKKIVTNFKKTCWTGVYTEPVVGDGI